ncbi:PadR family transcriptional regulator [Lysinibacillus odysseyi]|uniref:Transcriptional regulator n=1 Tax=Lysinibacillus odysseyi 34hs-1 = NBRC 100172 TaxID=1220589 RepID=A0A0A3IM06_9BACI|nr:PadR family transcriptional regulator [Lysinibacillus odysseyi]KGR85794.1 transcriptional regulator [Lysinibacillus odysseyi 34hs-1 = NBRC 100172]
MAIQIFILSKLMEENTYPYKLKKQISALQPLDTVNGLTESKLYYHFESLAKQGFIEAKEIIKEENRPDKQVFAITDKGREILPKKIYKLFENAETIDDMVIGLANMKYIDRDKAISLIEKKLDALKKKREYLSKLEDQFPIEPDKKVLADFLDDYSKYRVDGSLQFFERLIEHIQKGEI